MHPGPSVRGGEREGGTLTTLTTLTDTRQPPSVPPPHPTAVGVPDRAPSTTPVPKRKEVKKKSQLLPDGPAHAGCPGRRLHCRKGVAGPRRWPAEPPAWGTPSPTSTRQTNCVAVPRQSPGATGYARFGQASPPPAPGGHGGRSASAPRSPPECALCSWAARPVGPGQTSPSDSNCS